MKDEALQALFFCASNYTVSVSLQKRRLREDVLDVSEYLMGWSEDNGTRLCSGVSSGRTRGNERNGDTGNSTSVGGKTFLLLGW